MKHLSKKSEEYFIILPRRDITDHVPNKMSILFQSPVISHYLAVLS